MNKIILFSLILLSSILIFSSCFANREQARNSPENQTKTEKQEKTESKNSAGSGTSGDIENKESKSLEDVSNTDQTQKSAVKTDESSSNKPELRCGWYSNPTPGNHWIEDKDGEWIIGVQGGDQAEGDYPPEFSDAQWVNTNGNYGYGCACLRVIVDRKEQRILKVLSGNAKPLSACRNDPALTEPSE